MIFIILVILTQCSSSHCGEERSSSIEIFNGKSTRDFHPSLKFLQESALWSRGKIIAPSHRPSKFIPEEFQIYEKPNKHFLSGNSQINFHRFISINTDDYQYIKVSVPFDAFTQRTAEDKQHKEVMLDAALASGSSTKRTNRRKTMSNHFFTMKTLNNSQKYENLVQNDHNGKTNHVNRKIDENSLPAENIRNLIKNTILDSKNIRQTKDFLPQNTVNKIITVDKMQWKINYDSKLKKKHNNDNTPDKSRSLLETARKKSKIKNKIKKIILPLLIAYKLKFLTLIPVLIGGLTLLVGATGLAGFFFALFTAVMTLKISGSSQQNITLKQKY